MRADQRIDLYEWCLYQVVRHYLDPEFVRVKPSRPRHRKAVHVAQSYRMVMSVLAWHGQEREMERLQAFTRGVQSVGLYNLKLQPLEECGVEVQRDENGAVMGAIEISPLKADSAEALKENLPEGIEFRDGLVI